MVTPDMVQVMGTFVVPLSTSAPVVVTSEAQSWFNSSGYFVIVWSYDMALFDNTEEGLQEQHRGGVTGTTQRRGYKNNSEEGLQEQHRGGVTGTTQRRGYRNNTEEGLQEQHRGGVTGTTQRRGYRNNTEEVLQEQHRGGVTRTTQRRGYRKPPTYANTAHMRDLRSMLAKQSVWP